MNEPIRNEDEGLWTAEKVAAYLDLHAQTVYRKARTGEIPSLKVGNLLRFRPEEIRAWVEENTTRVTDEADGSEEVA